MVQTIYSYHLSSMQERVVLEKPNVLQRIFFSIHLVLGVTTWYPAKISFDDPLFTSFYLLAGSERHFEAQGEDIFQGNVWVKNEAEMGLWFAVTEILR